MKKFLVNMTVVAIALASFAFTSKKHETKTDLVYFQVSNTTTDWSTSTLTYPATQPMAVPSDPFGCSANTNCCAEGYSSSDIFQDTDGKWKPISRSLWQVRHKRS